MLVVLSTVCKRVLVVSVWPLSEELRIARDFRLGFLAAF